MKLSIIIVNYNVQFFLEQCLLSVKEASKHIVTEIIVIDNNSTDKSCSMLRAKFPEVQLIANEQNIGFSKANNQGVDKAQGEFILILNPDTVIAEDTIERIIDFADSQEYLGALGVKFIDGTGKFLPECKRNIPTVRIASRKILGNTKEYYASHISENENVEIDVLTGAFMLMRRKTFLKVGGFDEEYFMYGEDVDLSYKLLNNGYQNYYFGSSVIIHYKGESTIKNVINLRHFYGAIQIFYKKHFKINRIYNFSSKLIFKFLIWFNSLKNKNRIEENYLKPTLLFIGDNQETFEKIKQNKKFKNPKMNTLIPENNSDFDMIIFDNNIVSNKQIIENFESLKRVKIAKRIVPKGTNFYLGSDASSSKGIVINF